MNEAQLWSGCEEERKEKASEAVSTSSMRSERKSGGIGFGPFDVEWMVRRSPGPIPLPLPYPFAEVSLVAPVVAGSHLIRDCGEVNRSLGTCPTRRLVVSAPVALPSNKMAQQHRQQASRKARRCWSGELHRKFENALRELGGPDVATPKQIREMMKVEGLTNDEVKSHLQKYRMNSKKMSPAVQVDLHLKNSPVHSPDSPLELSRCCAWCGHQPGSCSYESTTDGC